MGILKINQTSSAFIYDNLGFVTIVKSGNTTFKMKLTILWLQKNRNERVNDACKIQTILNSARGMIWIEIDVMEKFKFS